MAAQERALYLGTANGLYMAEPSGSGYRARLLGLDGCGVLRAAVVVDKDDPQRLYAGTTRAGLFRSQDGGQNWGEINRGIVYKDVWSVEQHPSAGQLVAGSSPAAVFLSDDRGDTWRECEQLARLPTTKGWTGPLPPHVSRMKALSLHQDDPDVIYGAIEEGWAVRSLDGGRTWDQLEEGVDHDSHDIAVMIGNRRTVVATGGKGLYRSEDGGQTWEKRNRSIEGRYRYTPAPMIQNPATPKLLITAVTVGGPGSWLKREFAGTAFVRSEDEGESWQVFDRAVPSDLQAVPRGLVGDPNDPSVCYAGMTDGSVWVSRDGGESFRQILSGLPAVHSVTVAAA